VRFVVAFSFPSITLFAFSFGFRFVFVAILWVIAESMPTSAVELLVSLLDDVHALAAMSAAFAHVLYIALVADNSI
jgi:hypothetical protein